MIRQSLVLTTLLYCSVCTAESLRCGNKIVDTGMSMEEVKKYCGSPSSSSMEEQDVRSGNRVIGKTEVHTWRYKRASGQRTAVLQFDQDTLKVIAYESK